MAAAVAVTLPACAVSTGSSDEAADTSSPAATEASTDSIPGQLASADTDTDGAESDDGSSDGGGTAAPVGDASDPAADVISCTRVDDERLEFELVNGSSETSDYWMTVGFYDDAGQRVADTSEFITHLRSGERTIEQTYLFETEGTTCEVLDVDRTASTIDEGLLGEASACEITGEDFVGDVTAALSVTNGSSELSDYVVTVAITDADGVRRGTGDAWVEAVQPGETAPSDVYSTVEFESGQGCEVVAVSRTSS